jgi:hypothetical protein
LKSSRFEIMKTAGSLYSLPISLDTLILDFFAEI